MYGEDELLPLSGLQHLTFCERRAMLVCLEGLWVENVATVQGRLLHGSAHEGGTEVRGDLRIARGLRLRSLRLGLSGKADVVEFHRMGGESVPPVPTTSGPPDIGVRLPSVPGRWLPFPVEYKRGRLRHEEAYEIQLCAQALCLEEMLSTHIPAGAVYYGKTNRRLDVPFDRALRNRTEESATRLHRMVAEGRTPPARYEKKCRGCSLLSVCLPKVCQGSRSARDYLRQAVSDPGDGRS